MALNTYFESVAGEKFVVRTQDIKWAYPQGAKYFIEWYDPRNGTLKQAEISDTTFLDLYDAQGLVHVDAKDFGDTPFVGFIAANPHVFTLANNVGGVENFLGGQSYADDWSLGGSGTYGDWTAGVETLELTGDATPADNSTGLARFQISAVNGNAYSLTIPINAVDFDGLTIGTDFSLVFSLGSTNVTGTALNVVAGNTITVNFTASSTATINADILFTVLEEVDMSGLSIEFGKPKLTGPTTSTQLVGVISGTMVRYEIGVTPLQLLLEDSVATLASKLDTDAMLYTPTGVNGGSWNGGASALSSREKVNVVNEVSSGVSIIDLKAQASNLQIKTSTAIASLV